jgi:predicted O-methyltransferase YrrM
LTDCAAPLYAGPANPIGSGRRLKTVHPQSQSSEHPMGRFVQATDQLSNYLSRLGGREHPALARCRTETAQMGGIAVMQIAPEQGAFLAMLVRLLGARACLEVGTFTGYSALATALALPADGRLVALDVSRDYADKARGYWREAGVEEKIDLRLGPALQTLDAMLAAGEGPFDFAFVDADKTNYDNYYERALKLVRPGGLIAFDNMLWSGAVADPAETDEATLALRALNAKIHADERVDMALATVGDGVMLARVR